MLHPPQSLPWFTAAVYDSSKPLPAYKDLPRKHSLPCAWSVWGVGDQLGTINLLTPERVKAASSQIQDGLSVSLAFPLQLPTQPSFHRRKPEAVVVVREGVDPATARRDDEIHINTQSGTQWDGLRHFGILDAGVFYQGVPVSEVKVGALRIEDPLKIDPKSIKLGIHNWAAHSITGRGVFLDMVRFYTRVGTPLPYDPCTTHAISVADIQACARWEGVDFQTGDILILRIGWTQRYYASSQEEKEAWGQGSEGGRETFAGVENTPGMQEWLWDNHFAAVASDMPAFEMWPPAKGKIPLHSTLIGMYGSPIGEFFDLELLSQVCEEKKRFTFFFVSNPLNILGGCASTPNASAIF